ncbi:nicotinate-nucleotide adenylyltransferase [Maricaulis salignorans]|uniref:Probable nicotinate-nucleotide adenylyltransferase n=1 Tax=Maricaulis salignorans TaxID=144026 RepID=A0A1G9LMJ9_9PROT|nr:nicotinate-nucleotide adenylyltransferase [Maricaulis salignorans]SDL63073.1 nicotinate-nucleotide adenylyltransferase [Maricaulis salignorans]
MSRRRSSPMARGRLISAPKPARALRGETFVRGMKVGLFGGTFDPPHDGHLHVAEAAKRRLGLDRIWWLVSPQNPLKQRRAGELDSRMAAVSALADRPGMVVSDIETRLGCNRTIELINALQRSHPGVHFVWLMGADNLRSFHRWGQWRQIFGSVPIAVISRPQDSVRARLAPAVRMHADSRLRDQGLATLPLKKAPAWTYLIEPLNWHSSSALRAQT